MSKQSDTIKNLVKKNVAEKPTFGTDPRDPWSTKYNVTEDTVLNKYLLSRGINPKYVTKDQKVAHSKMGQFIKWKRDRGMIEQTTEPSPTLARQKELNKSKKHQTPIVKGVAEAVDKKDTVTFDIPLLIRVLELAREDVKTDMDLHRIVERLINMRNKGMLTMDDYDEIAAIKEEVFSSTPLEYIKEALNQLKEEVEQIDEVRRGGFTAGWRDEKYFGKGVPTNRPMTDKEKAESEKTKDIQNYLNNLSKNRLKKEDVELEEEFKKGDRVRHKDGTLGTVTREPDEQGIVSWKYAGNNHRVSHKSALKSAADEKFRWRQNKEEVEQIDEGMQQTLRKYIPGYAKKQINDKMDREKFGRRDVDRDVNYYRYKKVLDKVTKEEVELDEARYGGDAYQKDSASSVSGFGKSSRHDDEYHTPSKHYVRVQVSKGDGPKTHFKATVRAKEPQHAVSAAIAHYKKQGYTVHNHEYLGEQVEQIAEISDTTLASYKEKAKKSADALHAQGQYKKSANRWMNVMKATGKQMSKMKFENTLDPKAATEAPCDCANNPDDVAPQDKNKKLIQMSKSARIIKSIYKNKNMKEETYDHEKEDKSVATYGKKPKMSDSKKDEQVSGEPKAAAIMSGGTTLTGTPRDTIEIDPMMKLKPGLIGQTKNNNR